MTRSRLKAGVALSLFLMAAPVCASSTSEYGKVTGVYATASGALLFSTQLFEGGGAPARDTPPACGSGLPNRWAIDASTPAGQTAVTTLLWALDNRRQVLVIGTGTCSIWSDTETVAMISVQDSDG